MNNALLVLVAVLALLGFLRNAVTVRDAMLDPDRFDDLFKREARRVGVDWRLLRAIAMVESSLDETAVNPSDPSIGLMQVLCRADGGDGRCQNKFLLPEWDQATPRLLKNPEFNVRIGAQIIGWNVDKYGLPKAVAVYNKWSARKEAGPPFSNQVYVDKVMTAWAALTLSREA